MSHQGFLAHSAKLQRRGETLSAISPLLGYNAKKTVKFTTSRLVQYIHKGRAAHVASAYSNVFEVVTVSLTRPILSHVLRTKFLNGFP